jgi:16S rRNA (cytidine1402-2'-O)-methyltransferase
LKRDIGKNPGMASGLYVVATPIGNLGDITTRALEVLRGADVIAAEDTRVTRGLLSHFGISAKVIAVHAHNEARAAQGIVDLVAAVVRRVREAGHAVIPIPGASALTTALSASGFEFEGVVFAGFLPARGKERRERLARLGGAPWAIVLFESPHRILETLADLHAALGDRTVVIARELTKRFESIEARALEGAAQWVATNPDRGRGEFVLVIEGREPEAASGDDPGVLLQALLDELPLKQAVALATRISGGKRNELYAMALKMKGK